MKRFFLAGMALAAIALPTVHAEFSDVPTTHPNFDAIAYVQNEGIVQGYADGTYKPDVAINRAEFLKIMVESFEDKDILQRCTTTPKNNFVDTQKSAWYSPYICAATQHGKRNPIEGYPDGTFRPVQNISFVEAAKLLVAYQETRLLETREATGSKDTTSPFSVSIPDRQHWYDGFVFYLAEKNAIPLSITTFDKPLTRGEMAEIIFRLRGGIEGRPSQSLDGLSTGKTLDQKDVAIIERYYSDLQDSSTFRDAYDLRVKDNVDYNTFTGWYAAAVWAEVFSISRNADGSYHYLVLLREEGGKKNLFDVTMRVTAQGKLQTAQSKQTTKGTLWSTGEGATSVSMSFDNGDLVLMLGYVDGTKVEVSRIKEDVTFDEFAYASFAQDQRYLLYSVTTAEGRGDVVYDTTTNKTVHSGFLEDPRGFTANGKFYYACTENGIVVGEVHFYSVPDFQEIPVDIKTSVRDCGKYDPIANTFTFREENNDMPLMHVFNFTTQKLQ